MQGQGTTLSYCAPGWSYDQASATTNCNPCGYGRVGQGDVCTLCGSGASTSTTCSTLCHECQAGTVAAAGSNAPCTPCSAGRFQASSSGSSCAQCSNGFTSAAGATNCSVAIPPVFSITPPIYFIPTLPLYYYSDTCEPLNQTFFDDLQPSSYRADIRQAEVGNVFQLFQPRRLQGVQAFSNDIGAGLQATLWNQHGVPLAYTSWTVQSSDTVHDVHLFREHLYLMPSTYTLSMQVLEEGASLTLPPPTHANYTLASIIALVNVTLHTEVGFFPDRPLLGYGTVSPSAPTNVIWSLGPVLECVPPNANLTAAQELTDLTPCSNCTLSSLYIFNEMGETQSEGNSV